MRQSIVTNTVPKPHSAALVMKAISVKTWMMKLDRVNGIQHPDDFQSVWK